MKTLISFDGSTTASGYAIFKVYEDKTFVCRESGTLIPPKPPKEKKERRKKGEPKKKTTKKEMKDGKKQNMIFRMNFFFDEIKNILLKEKSLGFIVFEDSYLGKDADAFKWLCRLHGFFMGYAKLNNLVCEAIYPTHWRSVLGIATRDATHFFKREELKEMSFKYCHDVLHRDIKQEDECEAYLIGHAYLTEKGYTEKVSKK